MLHGSRVLLTGFGAAAVTLAVAVAARADVFQMPPPLKSLEFVAVDHPGNAADTTTGLGAVGYRYQIGKFDVTAAQYVEFLNAVAADDSHGLYYASMSGSIYCNIQRAGSPGSYSYSVDSGSANRPVNFVSFGAAARFCNWLTNGQPTGAQDVSTTEDGSYSLNDATSDAALLLVTRKAGARYVLPTADEWYKAAYHKNDGVTGDYWLYPARSDEAPTAALPPGQSDPPGSANYLSMTGTGPRLTDVGAYTGSASPYGTFDQGGLLYQWTDTVISSPPWYTPPYTGFAMFSSSYMSGDPLQLRSDYQIWPWSPTRQYSFLGFRVARLPDRVAADLDQDGDVDAADYLIFAACMTGPAIPYDPDNLSSGCTLVPDAEGRIAADFDRDGDVDQDDFGVFQRRWSGPERPAVAGCED